MIHDAMIHDAMIHDAIVDAPMSCKKIGPVLACMIGGKTGRVSVQWREGNMTEGPCRMGAESSQESGTSDRKSIGSVLRLQISGARFIKLLILLRIWNKCLFPIFAPIAAHMRGVARRSNKQGRVGDMQSRLQGDIM